MVWSIVCRATLREPRRFPDSGVTGNGGEACLQHRMTLFRKQRVGRNTRTHAPPASLGDASAATARHAPTDPPADHPGPSSHPVPSLPVLTAFSDAQDQTAADRPLFAGHGQRGRRAVPAPTPAGGEPGREANGCV